MTDAAPLRHSPEQAARIALACLDLTSLKADDSEASIEALARRAATPHGAPAALCVYPRFVPVARRTLAALGLGQVAVATVVNFPQGDDGPADTTRQIEAALALQADEIDAVIPWRALRAGRAAEVLALARACRAACDAGAAARGRAVPLKLILETGELREPALMRQAAELACEAGADFLKTSTGTVAVNATPESVAALAAVIAARGARTGLKIAGGVARIDQVQAYLAQAAALYGEAGLTPARLRFGASGLLNALLATLDGRPQPGAAGAGY